MRSVIWATTPIASPSPTSDSSPWSNHQVTFRWRDSAYHSEHKLMTLALDEFLRRFLLHLLRRGFVRIRHFGFLANRRRTLLLPLRYRLLEAVQTSQSEPEASPAKELNPLWLCPQCGGPMVVIQRLTAAQLQLRSPPGSPEPMHKTPIRTSLPRCFPSPGRRGAPRLLHTKLPACSFHSKLQSNRCGPDYDWLHHPFSKSFSSPQPH